MPLPQQVFLQADRPGGGVRHRVELPVAFLERAGPRARAAILAVIFDPVVLAYEVVQPGELPRGPLLNDQRLFALRLVVRGDLGFPGRRQHLVVGNLLQGRVPVQLLRDSRLQRQRVELQDVHRLNQLRRQPLLLLEKLTRDLR